MSLRSWRNVNICQGSKTCEALDILSIQENGQVAMFIAKRDNIVLSDISLQWCVSVRNAPRKAHDFTAVKFSVLHFTPILDYSNTFDPPKKNEKGQKAIKIKG